tara:strand:- start:361 stop:831 length:471 start_codon:yes stop_codon:yes gene_type:complete
MISFTHCKGVNLYKCCGEKVYKKKSLSFWKMPFDSNLPTALKVVYGINIFFVSLLTIGGFLIAQGFVPLFLSLGVLLLAYLYWHFLTRALVRKKKYSYWLNLIFHGFTIISFVISLFTAEVVWFDLIRIFNVAAIYLLLRKEVRDIFILRKQTNPV